MWNLIISCFFFLSESIKKNSKVENFVVISYFYNCKLLVSYTKEKFSPRSHLSPNNLNSNIQFEFWPFQIQGDPVGSRISLEISAKTPVALVPVSSRKPDLLIADLGKLTVNNTFKWCGDIGTLSYLKLDQFEGNFIKQIFFECFLLECTFI